MVFGKDQKLPIVPNGMLGKHHTEKAKRKIGLGNSKALKGRKLSKECKRKISETLKGRKNPKTSERLKQLYKEGKLFSKGMLGKHHSNETKEKMSERLKNRKILWTDKILKSWNYHPNKKEQFLNQILQENFPNEFKFVGDGSIIIEGFCPDFINCNGKKLIIELFGEYHHNLPEVKERDKRRLEIYSKYGYKTLIIWSNELKNYQEILKHIRNFLCDNSGTTPLKIMQNKEIIL